MSGSLARNGLAFAADRPVAAPCPARPHLSQLQAAGAQTSAPIPGVARLTPRYRELRVPLTVMAGTGDRIVDHRAHTLRLHREVPGSTLHLLTGSGHTINQWRRDEVLAELRHLGRVEASEPAAMTVP